MQVVLVIFLLLPAIEVSVAVLRCDQNEDQDVSNFTMKLRNRLEELVTKNCEKGLVCAKSK